jgi:4-azaleucine resistance transporter AzlC
LKLQTFFKGVRDETPLLLAVMPFGVIYGIMALEAGLTRFQAQSMSYIIFGGSSQFVASKLFAESTPWSIIVLTVVMVNLRHLLYSASVAPYLKELPLGWKATLSYLLTDEAYAVTINHYQKRPDDRYGHLYFLGAGLILWLTWQMSTAAGIYLGKMLPSNWPLDFFLPLTFIAILVPSLNNFPAIAVALTAGICSIFFYGFPYKLGLIAAALAGMTTGFIIDMRRRRP